MKGRCEYVLLALALVITLILISFNFDSLPSLPSIRGSSEHGTTVSKKYAVVSETFSDDYVPGALVLAHSLRRHNSKSGSLPFDLILVTFASEKYKNGAEKHLSPRALELLENAGWKIKVTDPIKQASFITPSRFKNNLSALRAFEHTEYESVAHIDSDCLILQDITEPFEYTKGATKFWAAEHYVKPNTRRFNSGVWFIKPSKETFDDIKNSRFNKANYDLNLNYPINNLLIKFFNYDRGLLPTAYNLGTNMLSSGKQDLEQWDATIEHARVIHYLEAKPWHKEACSALMDKERCEHAVRLWVNEWEMVKRELGVGKDDFPRAEWLF
ncbi:nucleotide-diphospho-sugar transferase [Exophiala viscosa]|uniref:nucleotide-diphospho-sugar transferase n=1 Tax=Exophiala viscosa TaxID=2486360 RepID=UPI0021964551|nr:nucleotide-diphospho-sugar transferase [Exophiala viscosa]